MAEQIFERLPNVISSDIDDDFSDQNKVESFQDQNSVSTDINVNSENTQTDSELFQSWQDVEQQYEAFQLDTLNFFKNDLLPNGLRKPDFPKSGIDQKIEACRYRAKLYNEFRNFAEEEIRQRPRDPIIPNRVSEADIENLDEIIAGDYSAAKTPIPVSTALMPASSNTSATTTIQPSFLRKTFSDRPNPLAHLEFQNTPTIPNPVNHPKWELMRVISGHTGWVRCLDVDISNEWFVSGGNDRLIKVWDLASGTLKLTLTGHINTIRSVIISNRHAYLFSCGEDQMIKCWDLEYNKVIRHYHGHLSGIYCMTLHPSLEVLATGGRDATVRLWDIRTKMAVHVLSGHTGTVMSLVSQRYEPQIVSGSLDKMIRCWDIVAGKTTVVLTHHKKAIRSLAFHPTEYTFCSAGADNLKVWKLPKANFERNLENVNAIINSIAIKESNENQNVSLVIGGSDQGHLYFWDWKSGRLCQDIETIPQPGSLSSEKAIYSLCLDKSETRLLTGECDKTIKVWRQKLSEDYDEV